MEIKLFEDLQSRLNYQFRNLEWLQLALTHSSWAHEAGFVEMHNERLEFLGDAVFELCVSTELYRRYPNAREGVLTSMRAKLVGECSLAMLARKIGIDRHIRLGIGEDRQGGRERDSVLSDAMEAVLAAVYQDGGFDAACEVATGLFAQLWPEESDFKPVSNNKSDLQEICQKMFKSLPEYVLAGSSGPEHAKIFEVCLTLPDGRKFAARASSCKKAEQACAAMAIQALEKN